MWISQLGIIINFPLTQTTSKYNFLSTLTTLCVCVKLWINELKLPQLISLYSCDRLSLGFLCHQKLDMRFVHSQKGIEIDWIFSPMNSTHDFMYSLSHQMVLVCVWKLWLPTILLWNDYSKKFIDKKGKLSELSEQLN